MRALKNIRSQLALIIVLCYLLPVVVLGLYTGGVLIDDVKVKTETALLTSMEYSATLTEENLQRLVTLARDATYDGELDDAADQRASGSLSDGEFTRLARAYIERKYGREDLITFAACFTLDNPDLLLVNRGGFDAAERYQRAAHVQVKAMSAELDTRLRFIQSGGDVYLVRNLTNLRMSAYGMLVLGVDMDAALQPALALSRQWDARLDCRLDGASLTGDGAPETLAEDSVNWDDVTPGQITPVSVGRYACARRGSSRDYALTLGLLLERRQLYGEIDAFRALQAAMLLLLVPILAAILLYVHKRISRPIELLSEASRRIEAGELGVTVPMRGDDELGQLGKSFSNMSLRIEELIDRTYKEEIALRDARIQAMQSRINPHFINNALETINWQARIEQSDTISAMVESLSVLLNAGMSRSDRRIVSLREELEVAKAYFYFVSLRFGDALTTTIDVDAAAMDAPLPVLTLQPLIENAAEHGIAPAGGGAIELRGQRAGSCLRLEVRNTGKPMDAQDRQRVDTALRGDNPSGAHLGLANISTRLRLIYGGRALVDVRSEEGWTVVTLEIPLE